VHWTAGRYCLPAENDTAMRGAPALARRHRQAAVHAAAKRLRIALDPSASAEVGTGQRAAAAGAARRARARQQIQIWHL